MEMYDDIIEYILLSFKDALKVGIEEEPYLFKCTEYASKMKDILDIKFKDMSDIMFERIVKEFISYLK